MSATSKRNRMVLVVAFLLIVGVASWLGDFLGQPAGDSLTNATHLDWGSLHWQPVPPLPSDLVPETTERGQAASPAHEMHAPLIDGPSSVSPIAREPYLYPQQHQLLLGSPLLLGGKLPAEAIRVVNVRAVLGIGSEHATVEQRQRLHDAIASLCAGTPVRIVLDSSALLPSLPPVILHARSDLDWTQAVTTKLKQS